MLRRITALLMALVMFFCVQAYAETMSVTMQTDAGDALAVGQTVNFTITGTGTAEVWLMIVTPDSMQHFVYSDQVSYLITMPGIYTFIAYGSQTAGKAGPYCMSQFLQLTATGTADCSVIGHTWHTPEYALGHMQRYCEVCMTFETWDTDTAAAYKTYQDLAIALREYALAYKNNHDLETNAGAVWRILSSQGRELLVDKGFLFGVMYTDALMNPVGAATGTADTFISAEDIFKEKVSIYKQLIIQVLSESGNREENKALKALQTAYGIEATIWNVTDFALSSSDVDFRGFRISEVLSKDAWKASSNRLEKMMQADQATVNRLSATLQDLRGKQAYFTDTLGVTTDPDYAINLEIARNADLQADDIARQLDAADDALTKTKTVNNIAKALPWVLLGVESCLEGYGEAQNIRDYREAYQALAGDYETSMAILMSILYDSILMNNAALTEATLDTLDEVMEEYKDEMNRQVNIICEMWENMSDFFQTTGAVVAEVAPTVAVGAGNIGIGMLGGGWMAGVTIVAGGVSLLTNGEEVYQSAVRLNTLSEMTMEFDLSKVAKAGGDATYSFQLWALVNAMGCDQAIDFIEQHDDWGIRHTIGDLNISRGEKNSVINALKRDKSYFEKLMKDVQ